MAHRYTTNILIAQKVYKATVTIDRNRALNKVRLVI